MTMTPELESSRSPSSSSSVPLSRIPEVDLPRRRLGRAVSLGTLAAVLLAWSGLGDAPGLALTLFFAIWTFFSFIAALAGAAYNDVIARTIPSALALVVAHDQEYLHRGPAQTTSKRRTLHDLRGEA
jgi:hypothetical protein